MPAAPAPHGGTATGAARRPARSRWTGIRRNLLTSVVLALFLWGMLANVGGTFAFWSSEDQVDAGTLTTGTAELTAQWSAQNAETTWEDLLPGETVQRSVELSNDGVVPLRITAATAEPTDGFTLQIRTDSCESSAGTGSLSTEPVPLVAAASDGADLVLQPGERTTLCLALRTADDLQPDRALNFHLTFEGTQTL